MRRVLPAILVVLALMISSTSFAETAGEMLSKCRPYENAKTDENRIAVAQDYDTGICWGAFGVIQEIGIWYHPDTRQTWLGFCAPKESRRSQYILIFINYAKKHPERLHEEFMDVALNGLGESWPCTPKSGNTPPKKPPKK